MYNTNQSQKAQTPRQAAAWVKHQLNKGEDKEIIRTQLLEKGFSTEQAESIITSAFQESRSSVLKIIWIGVGLALLGILLTWIGYEEATSNPYGGTYYIWYGAVICGVICFIIGLVKYSRLNK